MARKSVEFKQGDLVFVERKVERKSSNFQNRWVKPMDEYIGATLEVLGTGVHGVSMKGNGYMFPPSALRLIRRDGVYQFKVGDIVEVTHATPDRPIWVPKMDEWVGKSFPITRIDTSDNTMMLRDADGKGLWFPPDTLRLVGKESKYKNAPKPMPMPTQPIVLEAWERF